MYFYKALNLKYFSSQSFCINTVDQRPSWNAQPHRLLIIQKKPYIPQQTPCKCTNPLIYPIKFSSALNTLKKKNILILKYYDTQYKKGKLADQLPGRVIFIVALNMKKHARGRERREIFLHSLNHDRRVQRRLCIYKFQRGKKKRDVLRDDRLHAFL